ncbi:hypothetical protein DAQ1742_00802 [Dickeya aquatica]|uniref:Uncharacterized protein n=1 Tax=Dickeya aquatica TaxID=1401087 RepID=A0A375A8B3_9GAMM|nr:hypothetical protein DAQ1742_00802 [Dickeya aquatica]
MQLTGVLAHIACCGAVNTAFVFHILPARQATPFPAKLMLSDVVSHSSTVFRQPDTGKNGPADPVTLLTLFC